MADVLVIGYGNELRSDDAAGCAVAASIEQRRLPGVETIAVQQLVPELATEIGRSLRIVFVDADLDVDRVRVRPVEARRDPGGLTHHADPASLLALVDDVAAAPAEAVLVSVPASNLEFGFSFSPATEAAVHEAVALIVGWAARGCLDDWS